MTVGEKLPVLGLVDQELAESAGSLIDEVTERIEIELTKGLQIQRKRGSRKRLVSEDRTYVLPFAFKDVMPAQEGIVDVGQKQLLGVILDTQELLRIRLGGYKTHLNQGL